MADLRRLSAADLLAGTAAEHDVVVPARVLTPAGGDDAQPGLVRLRPLTVGTLVLISRAARDEPALVPLLLLKESLVDPVLTLDQLRALHAGLVHYLVAAVNTISGLSPEGDVLQDALGSPTGQVHLLLAQHFGWTPDQVAQLTPGQAAMYLAGAAGRRATGTAP
jgi:hypothetical protein